MPNKRMSFTDEVNTLLAEGLSVAAAAKQLETTESALRLRLARLGFRLEIKRQFVPWADEIQRGGKSEIGL